jgi:hypothetical protein
MLMEIKFDRPTPGSRTATYRPHGKPTFQYHMHEYTMNDHNEVACLGWLFVSTQETE